MSDLRMLRMSDYTADEIFEIVDDNIYNLTDGHTISEFGFHLDRYTTDYRFIVQRADCFEMPLDGLKHVTIANIIDHLRSTRFWFMFNAHFLFMLSDDGEKFLVCPGIVLPYQESLIWQFSIDNLFCTPIVRG